MGNEMLFKKSNKCWMLTNYLNHYKTARLNFFSSIENERKIKLHNKKITMNFGKKITILLLKKNLNLKKQLIGLLQKMQVKTSVKRKGKMLEEKEKEFIIIEYR